MIGSITGKFYDFLVDDEDNVIISFIIPKEKKSLAHNLAYQIKDVPLKLDIHKDIHKRTITANSYFHYLIQKIAEATNLGVSSVKKQMVVEYGTPLEDENGDYVFVKVESSTDISSVYKYYNYIACDYIDGVEYNTYLLYKQTHMMNKAEMARLIDGVVQEAKELGIKTLDEINLKSLVDTFEPKED